MPDTKDSKGRIIRTGPYPELTLTAVLVGYAIGILIAISIGYACLILGFSIEGSELAAILGFGILRGLLGRSSIIENNINQTIASAVNGASSGLMFSVPALFILGYDQNDFNPVLMVFACIAGGVLGIAFIIPLRKQMIDFERLTYPGGVAVATILKSPGAGIRKAFLLLGGMAVSATSYFLLKFFSLMHSTPDEAVDYTHLNFGQYLNLPEYMNCILFLSVMTIGVGFIAGKGGFSFIVGGFVCYWILAPLLAQKGLLPDPSQLKSLNSDTILDYLQGKIFKPIGIGMLIGGAITGIVLAFPLISSAIKSMQQASKTGKSISKDEMPVKLLYIGIVGAAVLLFVIAYNSTTEIGIVRGLIMALLGTLWIWIAGVVLSECIGRTNWSPLSGMTLIAVTILVIIAKDVGDKPAIISSIFVGAAACVAMSQATDLMMDLKTGYLVGASPRKQQIGQFLATWLGPIVVMLLIIVLHQSEGLGSKELPAPQGQALAGMIEGILGGDVPVKKYIAGATLGVLLSSCGIGGLGILVGLGFYLSFSTVLIYSIGMTLRIVVDKVKGAHFTHDVGIPIAAGLIVGEALVGVGFALQKVISGMVGG
jgi:putative OPT family oligopeptide transporter